MDPEILGRLDHAIGQIDYELADPDPGALEAEVRKHWPALTSGITALEAEVKRLEGVVMTLQIESGRQL